MVAHSNLHSLEAEAAGCEFETSLVSRAIFRTVRLHRETPDRGGGNPAEKKLFLVVLWTGAEKKRAFTRPIIANHVLGGVLICSRTPHLVGTRPCICQGLNGAAHLCIPWEALLVLIYCFP